jgi:hypothetical protein
MVRLTEPWRAKRFRAAAFVCGANGIAIAWFRGRAIKPSAMATEVGSRQLSLEQSRLSRIRKNQQPGITDSHLPARRHHLLPIG